ncbi:MAG: hypothetical protein AAF348_09760 [Bacteroidota bacterium]
MDRKQLEEYIQKLQSEAPEIINGIYEGLDHDDIQITRDVLRERTGCDMPDMSNRADALLPVIIIKALSGIQLTEEEKQAMDEAMAHREAQIKEGNWHPNFRWNGMGLSADEDEEYLY